MFSRLWQILTRAETYRDRLVRLDKGIAEIEANYSRVRRIWAEIESKQRGE